ncbi:MAG: ribose-phosphate pyrophosphokinase [Paracoccaceae bacterium]|nr:ribose-phosphate pyrophosphokinase [Paracoccaceae bacterium]MDE2914321.1 ribose-phosphate pyrophosphokinase [Paracoccaceae bacterium]
MQGSDEPRLIAGNSNTALATAIARCMSQNRGKTARLVKTRVERFNDQEIFVEVRDNVRGEDMFIVQSTSNPANDNLMELLIMADALRRSSARRITAVIPYFGYARQDRRTRARTPISAKLVANLLVEAGVERVLTMDLHSGQIQGFFDIPVDNLYGAPVFAMDARERFAAENGNVCVVSPDVGGVERARELAKRIGAKLAIVDKRRSAPGVVAEMTVIGDVTDCLVLIVDDICDTAGTLCKAADALIDAGAREVRSYITHGVLSPPATERIAACGMTELVITDSIPLNEPARACGKIRVLPTAPLLAQAITNIASGTSVSSLFDEEVLGPIYSNFRSQQRSEHQTSPFRPTSPSVSTTSSVGEPANA